MDYQEITVAQLKPGDILLCRFEHPGATEYFEALITALRYRNYKSPEEEKKFMGAAFTILRGLIIYFDQDVYTHAAFWDGKGVVEAGPTGVRRNPIDHYSTTNTDVYRFIKDGKQLGTDEYPVQPLLTLANEIVEENLDYSYTIAILMIFLCISRWERDSWIQALEKFITEHLQKISPSVIDMLFKVNHDKLVEFFEWFADQMILQAAKFRNDKGLVCSETVAAIFNQAKPVGKYHIQKPMTLTTKNEPSLLSVDGDTEALIEEFFSNLSASQLPLKTAKSTDWRKYANIIYTPHDLARSVNTEMIGNLKFSE